MPAHRSTPGQMQRVSATSLRTVTNRGAGDWQADADGEYRYFYDDKRRILEVRNGSDQVKQQWVYGTQYVDEIILMDNNGPSDSDDDCDPDNTLVAEIAIPGDQRYFYHQDRNWNVVALSTITDTSQYINGDIVERYEYTPYGQPTVIAVTAPDAAAAGAGNVRGASLAGNIFLHQGLPFDREKDSYQNRWRELSHTQQRFVHRDPLGSLVDNNSYQSRNGAPLSFVDSAGLCGMPCCAPADCCPEDPNSPNQCGQVACQRISTPRTGGTLCCNGDPCFCIFEQNFPPSDVEGHGLINLCVSQHESLHVNRSRSLGRCPQVCGEPGSYARPPDAEEEECYAVTVEMACYKRAFLAGQCQSQQCKSAICTMADNSVCSPNCSTEIQIQCLLAALEIESLFGCP